MDLIELRDKARAVAFLVDGLWLQRLQANPATNVAAALELALEVASSGQPLLPLGFLADFRTIALGSERIQINREHPTLPEWPATLIQKYDDHVLGKLAADWTMERACDALRGYEGRDRVKGVAFLLKQFRERAHIGGVELSPAILRELVNTNAKELMQQSYERVETQGFPNDILRWYEAMIDGSRRMVEAFGPEDIVALETRTALADMGEFVAMQQIVRASKLFREALPLRPVRALEGRKEIPSRILDEDQYPVGGYSSISNRGSMESLLHSQLAYMETDEEARPDLFDIKYVRDELYYYSRDENQFRRKRRSFVIVLEPSLIGSRFKDTDLPYQRIIMVQSFVIAVVQKLEEWLSSDAIHFDILLPRDREFAPLTEEAKLFELLLGDLRSTGILNVTTIGSSTPADNPKKSAVQKPDAQKNREAVTAHCKQLVRLAQVYLLVVGVEPKFAEIDDVVTSTLTVNGPRPTLIDGHGQPVPIFTEDATEHWFEAANNLLRLWV